MFKSGILVAIAFAGFFMSGCASQQTVDNTARPSTEKVETISERPPAPGQSVWKWKTIEAEFKGVRNNKVMVYDAEDKITFAVLPREIPLVQRSQFLNMREGTTVHIEVHSLVDENTGEVVKRELSKIWY